MPTQCPERDAGQSHDYDAGYCTYCDAPEPPDVEPTPDDEYPDSWVTLALEDAYSTGGDA
jgi:hypothetical protein